MKKIWTDLKNALATTTPASAGEEAVAHHAAAALMIAAAASLRSFIDISLSAAGIGPSLMG